MFQLELFKRMALCHPFFIALFFSLSSAFGQLHFSPAEQTQYNKLLNFDFSLQPAKPKTAAGLYLDNYSQCLALALSENPKHYPSIKKAVEQNIQQLEELDNNAANNYYLAESYLYLSFIEVIFDDKFSAYWDFRKAYHKAEKNIKQHPEFYPNYKTTALINVVIGSFPPEYNWVTHLLGFDGDLVSAHRYLLTAAAHTPLISGECYLLDALSLVLLAKNKTEGLASLQKAATTLKKQQSYALVAGILFTKCHQSEKAIANLETIPTHCKNKSVPYAYYLLGENYLVNGQYEVSIKNYQHFLQVYQGQHHIKSSYYKLFCNYYLNQQDSLATAALRDIGTHGVNLIETDQYAQRESEKSTLPNRTLLFARLTSDAGQWEDALQILDSLPLASLSSEEKIEYYYRKGRVEQELKHYPEAIAHFKQIVQHAPAEQSNYFIPNACLQLGTIYSELGKKDTARTYLKATLSFKNYPYEKSISRKAKYALQLLN